MKRKRLAREARRRLWRVTVALLAAALFAIVPAVQAYCCVDLPGGREAASTAAEDSGATHHAARCDGFPDAAVDDRMAPQDDVPLAGKPAAVPLVSRAVATPAFTAAAHPLWRDRAPPEPAFRRFPRLLL